MIKKRMDLAGLKDYRALGKEELEGLQTLLTGISSYVASQMIDVGDTTTVDEIGQVILGLFPEEGRCKIVWCHEEFGIELDFRRLIKYLDDFWYPSQDDLFVIEHNGSWAFLLSHEETLTVFSGPFT